MEYLKGSQRVEIREFHVDLLYFGDLSMGNHILIERLGYNIAFLTNGAGWIFTQGEKKSI